MPPSMDIWNSWTVSTQGKRLDREIRDRHPSLSKTTLKEWFQSHAILCNGRIARAGERVHEGDTVTLLQIPAEQPQESLHISPTTATPPLSPLEILYTNEDIIAINKPSGTPVHPYHPWERDTISQRVVEHFPELLGIGEARAPGLLHRLDNDTSGVLLFARHRGVYEQLEQAREQRQWFKLYVAWIQGNLLHNQCISTPIAHHPKNKKKMVVVQEPHQTTTNSSSYHPYFRGKPRPSTTWISPISRENPWFPPNAQESSLHPQPAETTSPSIEKAPNNATPVLIRIEEGTRHQIRVHLASMGHPIVGDTLYQPENYAFNEKQPMMLHAWRLCIPSPPLKTPLELEAPPPFLLPQPSKEQVQHICNAKENRTW